MQRPSERHLSMVARWFAGVSLRDIAAAEGISHNRVGQIVKLTRQRLRMTDVRPFRLVSRERPAPCAQCHRPVGLDRAAHRAEPEHVFWPRVIKAEGCWGWQGGRRKRVGSGYGYVAGTSAHRYAWMLANGPIPDGMYVCHHCDNPPCVKTEPDAAYPEGHLYLGTATDNANDRERRGRGGQRLTAIRVVGTNCKWGHPMVGDNVYHYRGMVVCRQCVKDRGRRAYQRRKAAA